MKINNFEATGLEAVVDFIKSSSGILGENDLREILKLCNISFVLEGINRLQSMLLCEMKDSYVQQSQRYVMIDEDGYILPDLRPNDLSKAKLLVEKAVALYQEMTVVKEAFKGRPKAEHYQYGIAIEDGRYILPVAMKTNITTAMSGDKLVDWFRLMKDKQYGSIFQEIHEAFMAVLPKDLAKALDAVAFTYADAAVSEAFYAETLEKITADNPVRLLHHFSDLPLKAGLGAITSTMAKAPSDVLREWGENAPLKARQVAERVIGYGHLSIIEQARATFGLMFSLVTYHQQERHRLPVNYRENLQNIIDSQRSVIVPPSIANSPFKERYLLLAEEFKAFRSYLSETYSQKEQYYFLLNCDAIKLLSATNARIDCQMLQERICFTAQWEIRSISTQKLTLLQELAPELYKTALPSCVYGTCKEGKMTCGRADEMRRLYRQKEGSEQHG